VGGEAKIYPTHLVVFLIEFYKFWLGKFYHAQVLRWGEGGLGRGGGCGAVTFLSHIFLASIIMVLIQHIN
jgi:hypothetical protein